MPKARQFAVGFIIAILVVSGIVLAQRSRYGRGYRDRDLDLDPTGRGGVPVWEVDPQFKSDVFTFVRIRYSEWGRRRGGSWRTDYPDAELNFSYRLQQLTSLKVDPNGKVLELTDDELFDHPFIYIIEPGGLTFLEEEVTALRRYLYNGGFLMVDDFWGDDEWANFYHEIKRVFPDREPQELPLDHHIFHCVYDLKAKPQIPSIHAWARSGGGTDEGRWDAQEPHYKAIRDDKGRIMVMICHNTDVGDGWEREGLDPEYFKLFSEKWSYPLGINIVFYAMTH